MGVWIETVDASVSLQKSQVTPFVGVWIETLLGGLFGKHNTSHPSWVCGLKQYDTYSMAEAFSHTLRGCVD